MDSKATIGKQNYQEPGVEAELNFEFFEFLLYLLNNDISIEALRFCPSQPLCYVMLCGLLCFVCSHLGVGL